MSRLGAGKLALAAGLILGTGALVWTAESQHSVITETVVSQIGTTPAWSPLPTPSEIDDPVQTLPAPVIPAGHGQRVPVLMYHYIRVNPIATDKVGFKLSVPPQTFALQVAYLHASGAHTLTLAQLVTALKTGAPLPPHPVVLTFDDGHDDFATQVVPTLRAYGFVGTDFVAPGLLGRPTYMSTAQVQQADRKGMVIGAHTVHHVNLVKVAAPIAQIEISASKALLEQLLGHPVLDFAFPYGSFNARTVALVKAAGFRDAVTTVSGNLQFASSPFTLERNSVGGGESLAAFATEALLPPPSHGWKPPTLSPATPVATTGVTVSRQRRIASGLG